MRGAVAVCAGPAHELIVFHHQGQVETLAAGNEILMAAVAVHFHRLAIEQDLAAIHGDGANAHLEAVLVAFGRNRQIVQVRVLVGPQMRAGNLQRSLGFAAVKIKASVERAFVAFQFGPPGPIHRLVQLDGHVDRSVRAVNAGDHRHIRDAGLWNRIQHYRAMDAGKWEEIVCGLGVAGKHAQFCAGHVAGGDAGRLQHILDADGERVLLVPPHLIGDVECKGQVPTLVLADFAAVQIYSRKIDGRANADEHALAFPT